MKKELLTLTIEIPKGYKDGKVFNQIRLEIMTHAKIEIEGDKHFLQLYSEKGTGFRIGYEPKKENVSLWNLAAISGENGSIIAKKREVVFVIDEETAIKQIIEA